MVVVAVVVVVVINAVAVAVVEYRRLSPSSSSISVAVVPKRSTTSRKCSTNACSEQWQQMLLSMSLQYSRVVAAAVQHGAL